MCITCKSTKSFHTMKWTIKGGNQRILVLLLIFDKPFNVYFRIIAKYPVGKHATE